MANIKISDLTQASGVADTNEFEINESGSSKKVTGSQISNYVRNDIVTADISDVTITATELEYLDGVTSNVQNQLDGKASGATQSTATWEAGTSTTESVVSPAKVKAAIDANAGGGGFTPTTVSGASQSLDLGSFNFFDAGTLTADTTISFTNVPTEARWTYTFIGDTISSYDIANASYDSVSFSVSSQESVPTGLFFKNDGTKMYVVGLNSDSVHQYSLSTAWDLSTASYDSVSFSVSSQDTIPSSLFFKDDGTKMYVIGKSNDTLFQYSLSTAWDLSTASYDSVSFSVSSQDTNPEGLSLKDDGTKMYVIGNVNDSVYQYSLSSAWDLSTASYDSVSFSVSSQEGSVVDLFFKDDGTKMYVVGSSGPLYQYSLSSAWDISTASYDSVSFSVSSQATNPQGLFLKDDGTKMYVAGAASDSVYQYSIGQGITLTFPSSLQNPPTGDSSTGDKVTYDFYTLDGGTTVYLTSEEIE